MKDELEEFDIVNAAPCLSNKSAGKTDRQLRTQNSEGSYTGHLTLTTTSISPYTKLTKTPYTHDAWKCSLIAHLFLFRARHDDAHGRSLQGGATRL